VKSTAKMYVTQDKRLLHVYLLFLTNNLLFYVLGHKKDVWIVVDPLTGEKIQTLSMDGAQKVCPSNAEHVLYIGRTGKLHDTISRVNVNLERIEITSPKLNCDMV
jgi:hypothetical protein